MIFPRLEAERLTVTFLEKVAITGLCRRMEPREHTACPPDTHQERLLSMLFLKRSSEVLKLLQKSKKVKGRKERRKGNMWCKLTLDAQTYR